MKYLLFLTFICLSFAKPEKRVWVCESNHSYAYHYFNAEKCEGLRQCRAKITETSLDSAYNVFKKQKLCGFCKYMEDEK
jgi:hypothetical protein